MSVLPVESLVLLLCSGWDLAALLPLLLVETSQWAVHHPTPSPSTHCASPMVDSTPAGLLLEVTMGQLQSWWIFQVGNWAHCTSLSLISCFKIWSNRKMTGKCVFLFFEIGSTVHNSNSQLLTSTTFSQAYSSQNILEWHVYAYNPNFTRLNFQFWGVRQAGSWGCQVGECQHATHIIAPICRHKACIIV